MNYFTFDDHQLSRIFKGNWQLTGGHGLVDKNQAIEDLILYARHGVNVFDVGDIYTGAEEIVGEFIKRYRQHYGQKAASTLRVHTKFVPDLNALHDLTKRDVRQIIERSIKRLGTEQLHMVQFHWWDYARGNFVQAGLYLEDLRQEGLIEAIGLTNFDVMHTKQLLDAGVPVKSNQIQFSLIDPRPLNGMLEFARKNDIRVFCYGALAGGLLGGARPGEEPDNRSHTKYGLMIQEVGVSYYEQLISRLTVLADNHKTSVANIAATFVLQTPGVSSVIIGPRNTKHIHELDQLDDLQLQQPEYDELRDLLEGVRQQMPHDVYSYERDVSGVHGHIMKYNLNGMRPERS